MEDETITLRFDELIRDSGDASLFRFEDEEVWIPHSLIEFQGDDTVEIPLWKAEQEGLEIYEHLP